jgi:molybdate/tungstate transport system ATP-binding protein
LIRLQNISWKAGAFALENVSFDVPAATYAVLMGRTGTGKTSLIEIICGLRAPQSGQVWLNDRDVTRTPPGERGLGFVPQDGALFPTMTVADQIGFALRMKKAPADSITLTVNELAAEMGITHLLDRKPTGLSGGEKQRVALARALAAKPGVLLLDEPLAAVDEDTQSDLIQLLKRTQQQHQITVLHVTHSRREAEALADLRLRLENHQVRIEPA